MFFKEVVYLISIIRLVFKIDTFLGKCPTLLYLIYYVIILSFNMFYF